MQAYTTEYDGIWRKKDTNRLIEALEKFWASSNADRTSQQLCAAYLEGGDFSK